MDIVYLVKQAEKNDELRYSLRSLRNIKGYRVWIVGYRPTWLRGTGYIPVPQQCGAQSKHPNALANLNAALNSANVSDPFWLFNDDFFITKPLAQLPQLTWGPVDRVLRQHDAGLLGGTFYRSMQWTREACARLGLRRPTSYQIHAPLLIHKTAFIWAMRATDALNPPAGIWPQYATVYGNQVRLAGAQVDRDVKIHDPRQRPEPWWHTTPYLSTSDRTWRAGLIGRHIRALHPEPSIYERR